MSCTCKKTPCCCNQFTGPMGPRGNPGIQGPPGPNSDLFLTFDYTALYSDFQPEPGSDKTIALPLTFLPAGYIPVGGFANLIIPFASSSPFTGAPLLLIEVAGTSINILGAPQNLTTALTSQRWSNQFNSLSGTSDIPFSPEVHLEVRLVLNAPDSIDNITAGRVDFKILAFKIS